MHQFYRFYRPVASLAQCRDDPRQMNRELVADMSHSPIDYMSMIYLYGLTESGSAVLRAEAVRMAEAAELVIGQARPTKASPLTRKLRTT